MINELVNIEIIDTDAPKAGPYNLGIKAGDIIFISGQVTTPDARDIKAQTLAALEKIKNILQAAGASVSNIVKVTVFLKNISEMNEAYADFFEQNGVTIKYPARSTVEATNPLPYGLIEIDAIALI